MAKPINQTMAFYAMTSLFFIWGFITALNDILIPFLRAEFSLSYVQANLVQFCFFGAYFLISPIAGKVVAKFGYRNGVFIGLSTLALGCLLFIPAASIKEYTLFLGALFVLAGGITVLQVSANPYVNCLGAPKRAASRLNLAQAINSLGHTAGPLFGTYFILSATSSSAGAEQVQLPYLLIALAAITIACSFKFIELPKLSYENDEQNISASSSSIWQQKNLLLGAMAIFLYVGAEVSIGGFLVNYFEHPEIGGLTTSQAGHMVAYYWGGAMIGRFIGAALMRTYSPSKVLAFNASMAICLLIVTVLSYGKLAMWSVLAVGFFNSIMFPTIFSLAIKGLGQLTAKGSGLLCQAIVGGALFPILQAVVADKISIQTSFLVPVFAYVYIFIYALFQYKTQVNQGAEPHKEAAV